MMLAGNTHRTTIATTMALIKTELTSRQSSNGKDKN